MRLWRAGCSPGIYLDDFDQEMEGAKRLLNYCRDNHYILNGDYICEEMTELNLFDNKKRNMFMHASGSRHLFKKIIDNHLTLS